MKFLLTLLTLGLFCFARVSIAKDQLSGVVINEFNNPIKDMQVTLKSTNQLSVTNSQREFLINQETSIFTNKVWNNQSISINQNILTLRNY